MAGVPHHVINRACRRDTIFQHPTDYELFLRTLRDAKERLPVRLAAFSVMPNHWHLILWPESDQELSQFMHWLTMTHTQRWHLSHGTSGTGPLYQGRYKAVPIESDAHFLRVARYVERNPVRAGLAHRAEGWPWGSAHMRLRDPNSILLNEWPVAMPATWGSIVNRPEAESELSILRDAIRRGVPYGDRQWVRGQAFKFKQPRRTAGRPPRAT